MKRLLLLLPLMVVFGCDNTVDVKIDKPNSGWTAYGQEPVFIYCHPSRFVDFVELLVDSAVVGVDTFPPYFVTWDVGGLAEGGVHTVQARATSGSKEYLSEPLNATVGYRSRIITAGAGDSLQVYLPNGTRLSASVPAPGFEPRSPRFGPGCSLVFFVADRRLYRGTAQSAEPFDSVTNGVYRCDASPVRDDVVFEGLPAQVPHLFIRSGSSPKEQLTRDSDAVYIDSSLFTGTRNSGPVFSPDGERIAFFREGRCLVPGDPHEGETRRDVFVMSRSGTGLTNFTPATGDGQFTGLSWTFDGKWLLFRDIDGAPARVLAANQRGRCFEVAGLSAGGSLACSPLDSVLLFTGSSATLGSVRIRWTDDTLYAVGQQSELGGAFGESFDWVVYQP